MPGFKALMLAAAMLLMTLIGGRATAQAAPDPVGNWHGTLANKFNELTLILTVTRGADGTLSAQIESRDQAPGRKRPVSDFAVADGRMRFKVGSGATYDAGWDAAGQQWQGKWDQGGAVPLNLSKGLPAPKPRIDGLDGAWEGTVTVNGATLRQLLRFASGDWGTNGAYDSPDQMVSGVVLTDLVRDGRAVRFSAFRGDGKFAGTLSEDSTQLSGIWRFPGQPELPTLFTRRKGDATPAEARRPQTPVGPFPYKSEEVAFDNPAAPGVRLAGTLTLPAGKGPFPAVILISGSGPQDRDEAIAGHRPFAVIADYLSRRGIAVLRYDDRGAGKSTGDFGAATSVDHASDANAAFAWLAAQPGIRRDAIGFAGHSEGGIIGPIAMASNDKVAFLVALAGPGEELLQLLLSQRRLVLSQMGMSEADLTRAEPVFLALARAVASADTPEAAFAAGMAVMTPDAKARLGMLPSADPAPVVRQVAAPWFRYLLRYDPRPNLARIRVPVLALFGTLDRQVPAEANSAGMRAALKANPDATIVVLPGLNHLFQTAKTGSVGEYRDIEESVSPAALALISDWIGKRFGVR